MIKQYMLDYNEQLERIKQGTTATAIQAKEALNLRQFCIVTASFRRLLPSLVDQYGYEAAFIELMWRRRLATMDESSTDRVFDIEFTGNYQPIIEDTVTPRIFCAYHLGSYRSIIGALAKLGYDFTLIVNGKVYKNQKETIRQTVIDINERFNTSSNFEILNAEAYDTAMKMVKHLKKGQSIIAYADGNTGTGGAFRKDEKLLQLNFLDQAIFARQGITYASFLANVPIVPVISYRKKETDIMLEFFEAIDPAKITSRKQYCQTITKQLFAYLEAKIRQYPLQWEGWLYVHKYLNNLAVQEVQPSEEIENISPYLINKSENNLIEFNHERFSLFVIQEEGFLFDRDQYKAFPLEKEVFQFLKNYWNKTQYNSADAKIADEQWSLLLRKNILQINKNNYLPL